MEKRFGLLGAGNLGLSFAYALRKLGISFVGVNDILADRAKEASKLLNCPELKSHELAKTADVILLAVQDDKINTLYDSIKAHLSPETIVLIFSGTLSSSFIKEHPAVSAHPAQTFPFPRLNKNAFKDVYFVLEGDKEALKQIESLICAIGAKCIYIETKLKPLYHSMCVMSSGLLTGLLKSAEQIGESLGIDVKNRAEIILSLARNTLENALKENNFNSALSGPIARGDVRTIEENLASLTSYPEQLKIYKQLSFACLRIVEQKGGVSKEKIERIRKILNVK